MLAKKEIMNAMYYVLLRPVFYFGSRAPQSVSQQPVLILAYKILMFNHVAFAPYPGTKVPTDVAS